MATTTYKVDRSGDTFFITGAADNILYLQGFQDRSQISLSRPATPKSPQQPIGSASMSRSSAQINMTSGALNLEKAGMFSHSSNVRGPGIDWEWQSSMFSNYTLVDKSTGSQVATYQKAGTFSSSWTLQTFGSLEPQTFEAVVLSGLAAVAIRERKKKAHMVAAVV